MLVLDEAVIDPLERDRLVRKDRWHCVGCQLDVREAQHDERPLWKDGQKLELGA